MVFLKANGGTFRVYEILMKAFGVWPLDRHTRQSRTVFSITILTQMVICLVCLMHPLPTCLSDKARQHSIRIVFTILAVLGQISLRLFGRSMIPLIEATTEDWSSTIDPNECDIMERHNRSWALFFIGAAMYFTVKTPIVYLRHLPFIESFTPMGEHEVCEVNDDSVWFKLLPYLSFCTYFCSHVMLLTGVALYWSFAMHLSGQYKILEQQCQDFLLIKEKKVSRKEFRRIVTRHNELLESCGDLEDSLTVFVALIIFVLQILICIETYSVVIDYYGLSYTSALSKIGIILFLANGLNVFYYAGDYLTECGEDIGEVFTQCNWYDLSKESRTNFSIVIARCRKAKTLTAVKMYKLNLSNSKYVFNALYSYMSCIIAITRATRE